MSQNDKRGKMKKVYLCTFADMRLGMSACRFKQEAENLNIFDEIFVYNETSLELDFLDKFKDKMYEKDKNSGEKIPTRGFGYWCWKPQIILQSLARIQDGDLLLYLDVGCSFDERYKDAFYTMFEQVDKNEIMGFSQGAALNRVWCKADILKHYNLLNDDKFLNSDQLWGGEIFLKKCQKSTNILNELQAIFVEYWNLIDDSPSVEPNLPDFKENRHDQSVWSVIAKKHNLEIFSEKYHVINKEDNIGGYKAPFIVSRDKIYLPKTINQTRELFKVISPLIKKYNKGKAVIVINHGIDLLTSIYFYLKDKTLWKISKG